MKKARTQIAELIFDDKESILTIRVIDGAEMNLENTKEHYKVIKTLTENKPYGALIDATNYYAIDAETLEMTATSEIIDKRIAAAHFNSNTANSLTANFFKSQHKPPIPFQLFKYHDEAVEWLKIQMKAVRDLVDEDALN